MSAQKIIHMFMILCLVCASSRSSFAMKMTVHGNEIALSGMISPGSGMQFRQTFNEQIRVVRITSGGGSVGDALEIAKIMLANEVDVIVERACLSSCANYIFLAGKQKSILSGALVCFHGGPFRTREEAARGLRATLAHQGEGHDAVLSGDAERDIDSLLQLSQPLVHEQSDFFAKIGVSEEFIYPGRLHVPSNVDLTDPNETRHLTVAWCPGPVGYQDWNVRNVAFETVPSADDVLRIGRKLSKIFVAVTERM